MFSCFSLAIYNFVDIFMSHDSSNKLPKAVHSISPFLKLLPLSWFVHFSLLLLLTFALSLSLMSCRDIFLVVQKTTYWNLSNVIFFYIIISFLLYSRLFFFFEFVKLNGLLTVVTLYSFLISILDCKYPTTYCVSFTSMFK